MMTDDLAPALWRKSTYSSGQAACIQVAELTDGATAVRDSKNPNGPTLIVTPASWAALTAATRQPPWRATGLFYPFRRAPHGGRDDH
jgi:hypothetical protein